MVYITNSNRKKLLQPIAKTAIGGDVYKKVINYFDKEEEKALLVLRCFYENPEKFFSIYEKVEKGADTRTMVFEGVSPAYHKDRLCNRLNADYINYFIPLEIVEKDKAGDEEIINKYRNWFIGHQALILDNPQAFNEKLQAHWRVAPVNMKSVVVENSGVTETYNYNLEELEYSIDKLLEDALAFIHSSSDETKLFCFDKVLSLTEKNSIVSRLRFNGVILDNVLGVRKEFDEKFKAPLKDLLEEWYKILPRITEMRGQLLEKYGFKSCSECYRV